MKEKFEQQQKDIFYNMLKGIGAYLDGPRQPIADASHEASPRVSVVIPAFNRQAFIGPAIDSVLSGSYDDFEIIVVDNGSSDGTIERVESYVKQDRRVRLIKNQKNVIGYSLNLGLNAASGKYIAQLDSDDQYMPDTLREMAGHLDAHPFCGLAISYYEMMDEHGRTNHKAGVIKHLEYDRNNILRNEGAGAVRVWRRPVLLEMGGFNEEEFGNYGEDYDMILKVSEKYEVDRVHRVLYRYRRHPGNTDHKVHPYSRYRGKMLARLYAIQRRAASNNGGE
jgi:glycosyltransferase involved in cell wall biosynthesis